MRTRAKDTRETSVLALEWAICSQIRIFLAVPLIIRKCLYTFCAYAYGLKNKIVNTIILEAGGGGWGGGGGGGGRGVRRQIFRTVDTKVFG